MPVRALMPPGQPRAERRCCGFPLLRLRSWISQGGSRAPFLQVWPLEARVEVAQRGLSVPSMIRVKLRVFMWPL